ncbi:MAG TPA: hybrid sensor histidine kinase/response regulator [Polyangia bacterium]|jgi:signal transduction histidine kinase|nr:hybrid sensor histidine kinase/response regulator [Polyangia bacterium]
MTGAGEPEPPSGRKLRLLAIDDEPRILRLMNAVLAGSYDLTVAGDGEQGLRLALSGKPDLILTDFNMPKMTGQELLRRLRQEPSLEDVPVIVLTGHEDDQLRVDLLRNGAQDFLVKPFSVEELRVRIANLLRVKQARELLQEELQSRERDIGALVAEVAARRAALQAALETAQVARDQAEKASHAKTTFLALVSHELRTPLAVLRLTVDRLRDRTIGPGGGGAPSEVQRMEAALDRLKSIVDGVIDYTTIQSGRLDPRPERTDLAALVATLRLTFELQIEAKGLRLDIDIADKARFVTVDPRILRLILSNLIGNAIKYTDQGFLQLRAHIDGGLVLTVRDSGRGIDPLDAQRIFEPFEHGERIENKTTPGVGMGLTVVRDLAAALGGRVTLMSEKGIGSTFTVVLPV